MTNLIDITDLTDRVLDIYLRAKGGEDNIVCDHLTVTERGQIARLMGWPNTAATSYWIQGGVSDPADPDPDTRDYEGAILDQADERYGE